MKRLSTSKRSGVVVPVAVSVPVPVPVMCATPTNPLKSKIVDGSAPCTGGKRLKTDIQYGQQHECGRFDLSLLASLEEQVGTGATQRRSSSFRFPSVVSSYTH